MLIEVVGSLLLLVVTFVVLLAFSPLLTALTLVAVPPLVVAVVRYQRRSRPAYLALRDRVADTLTALQEGLSGIRVVQSFGRERDRFAALQPALGRARRAWRRVSLVNIGFFPVISLAQAVSAAAVHRRGRRAALPRRGEHGHGRRVRALPLEPVRPDRAARRLVQRVPVGPGRADEDRRAARDAGDGRRAGTAELPAARRAGRARTSSSRTARPPACSRRVARLEPGEHLALVGPTGAGKSTLAKLLTRALRPEAGRGRFGGVDLRDATTPRCAGGSSSCRRRATSSRARSPTTCGSGARTRATRTSPTALARDRRATTGSPSLPDGLADRRADARSAALVGRAPARRRSRAWRSPIRR